MSDPEVVSNVEIVKKVKPKKGPRRVKRLVLFTQREIDSFKAFLWGLIVVGGVFLADYFITNTGEVSTKELLKGLAIAIVLGMKSQISNTTNIPKTPKS